MNGRRVLLRLRAAAAATASTATAARNSRLLQILLPAHALVRSLGVTSTAACIRCVGWQDTGDALTGLAWGTAVARVHDKMPETIKALASVARNVTHVKLARSP